MGARSLGCGRSRTPLHFHPHPDNVETREREQTLPSTTCASPATNSKHSWKDQS